MDMWISFLVIAFMIVFGIFIFYRIHRVIYLEKRIRRYSVMSSQDDISFMDRLEQRYRKFLSKFSSNDNIKRRSLGYKKYITLGEQENPVFFLLHKLVLGFCFTILVIISSLLSGNFVSFFGIIISFVVGYYLYDVYLYFSSRAKKRKIKNDMLRAVILMNNSFKAGKSILQSVYIASEKLPKPIGLEFRRIYQDMSYGLSADVAFSRFSKRVNLEEANYVASSLIILNKTGGNIVSVFNTIEKTLFDRKKLENDLKTSAAASNFVVKFLMIIPFVFAFIIYIVSPTYFEPLFSSPLGYFVLFLMFLMFVIFIYLLNKIMKVKV